MAKPYQMLHQFWASEPQDGVRWRSASEAEVAALELKYDVRLPVDFRDYLLNACPLSDDEETDINFTTWWGIDRIRSVPDEYEHALSNDAVIAEKGRYLFFADHVFCCMAWALNCAENENRGPIVVFNNGEPFAAGSFAAFVAQYLKDYRPLLDPQS